jgi:hypothetical protein
LERGVWARTEGRVVLERKEVSKKIKAKVNVKEVFLKSEMVKEFEYSEEDQALQ